LLCPISPTFARFSSESKAGDWDEPTWLVKPRKTRVEGVGTSKIWWILYWRQVVSALALITFAQEGYYFLTAIPVTAIEASRRDILPEFG
jgi:hypothetical protein